MTTVAMRTSATEKRQMPDWISIADELPPINEPVLFCCYLEEYGFGDIELGWYEGKKTNGVAIVMETTSDGWYPCTHWMALPKVPMIIS